MKGSRINLRKSRKVPLAMTCYAALHQDSTIPLNTHCSSFLWYTRPVAHSAPREFSKSRKANAQERGIIFLPVFPLLLSPSSIVSHFKRPIQRCLVIAAIIFRTSHSFIRKGFLRNEISSAYLGRIESQFMGNAIHCSLQNIRCFGSTCSPVSSSWNLVGEHAHDLAIHRLYLVWAVQHMGCPGRNHRCCRGQKCTQIGNRTYFETKQPPIILVCSLDVVNLSSSMRLGLQIFTTTFYPFNRTAISHS